MRQQTNNLQSRIDDFLERKSTQYPELQTYTRDVYRLRTIAR